MGLVTVKLAIERWEERGKRARDDDDDNKRNPMREPLRWSLHAPEPHIALGTVFESAQVGVTAVQLFARSVQRRRIRLQHPSLLTVATGAERTVSINSNNCTSSRTPQSIASSQHASARGATLAGTTLRDQAAHVSSSQPPLLITIGCENGPLGCPWVVDLERVESSSSSSLSSQYRVSFLDLNHDLRHCTEHQSHSLDGMDDSDAELRLHQLFASPVPISENVDSNSPELELGAGISSLPEAFFQHQQQQIGVLGGAPEFKYLPSLSATPTAAETNSNGGSGFDSFELEKYAINHVASTFAPSPMVAGPPSTMLFDMGTTGGFAPQYHHHHHHSQQHQQQTWNTTSSFQNTLQHQQLREHLGSGHSTPLGSEAIRMGTFDATGRNHRDRYEPAAMSSTDASPQPRAHTTSYASSSSPGSSGLSSALAEKQSVTLSTKMRWISAKEASKSVNDYALFVQKKRARMDKKTSGGRNKKYICSCAHCTWFVRLIKVAKSGNWKISSMQLAHSDDCTGEAQPSARQLAELNTLRNRVLSASNDSSKLEITHEDEASGRLTAGRSSGGVGNDRRLLVQTDFTAEGESLGVKIPVRLAYRAKKILQENSSNAAFSTEVIVRGVLGLPGRDLQEKIAESYKLLPSLLQKFSDLNPDSVVCLRKDERGRFKSAFVLPAPLAELLPTLQSVFGLEIVPCGRQIGSTSNSAEPPRYNGQFIVLLGKDGNLDHRVIAFGLIPIPDTENVAWFLRSLHNAGFQMGDAPVFLAYHQLGALAALRREFPRVLPMFCVESFIATIEQQLVGTVSPFNLESVTHQIRLASLAETLEAFRAHMDVVGQHFPSIASFLQSFDASLWTLHASRAVKKYHWNATGLRAYMSVEVQIVVKTKRPAHQQRQTGRASRGQQQQLYVEASSGFDVQRISSIQLADFDTMVPLEIIYQFLLHYMHVEACRAVEVANIAAAQATGNSVLQSPLLSVQLTPGAEKHFHQELFEAEHVKVCTSEDSAVALVLSKYATNANGDGGGYRVHVDDGRCSCAAMYQLGIPCRHFIATARAFKGEKTILTKCDKIYTLTVYQAGVQRQSSLEDRMPVLGGLNRDSSIYPAPIYGSADEADSTGAPVRSSSGGSGKRRARDDWGAAFGDSAATGAAMAKRTHLPSGSVVGASAESARGNSSRSGSASQQQQQQPSADLVFDNCIV